MPLFLKFMLFVRAKILIFLLATSLCIAAKDLEKRGPMTTLTPSSINSDKTFFALGDHDLDGDEEAYSFRWIVDGVTDLDETTSTFPASKTAKGTRVQVVVTPTDGASDGEDVASETITVGNTPPEPGVVEITPELPEPGEALVCEVIEPAVDVDGDAFTYVFNWSIDGEERPEYITLSTDGVASIPVGDTANAETWTCNVYADDGIDFSDICIIKFFDGRTECFSEIQHCGRIDTNVCED